MDGRWFGNSLYYYNCWLQWRKDADAKVFELRKAGNWARVVPVTGGYEVWDKRKTG
ncbi:hypothetical protein LCGC14_1432700 [marine sediment metagenome]|uniref:Uncharacterized protein n=1 Tax=marine sediment metagenome TaxID=412755 RepID=A0A0F9M3K7_9ZZZZ